MNQTTVAVLNVRNVHKTVSKLKFYTVCNLCNKTSNVNNRHFFAHKLKLFIIKNPLKFSRESMLNSALAYKSLAS